MTRAARFYSIHRLVLVPVVLFAFLQLKGQNQQNPIDKAFGLEGLEFVDYVLDNYYALYSQNFDTAISLTGRAKQVSLEQGEVEKAAYASLYVGVINYLRGNYEDAIKAYQFSESTFDSLGSVRGLARTHNEMAVYFHKNNQLEKALELLDASEKEAQSTNDTEALGTSLSHRASFLSRRGKYDEAYPIYKRVYEIRKQEGDSVGLGYVLLDLAEYQLQQGNLAESIELVEASTDIRLAIGDQQGVAVNTVIMGENYFHVKDYIKAIPYFEKTIDLASKIGFTDLIRFSYDMLQQAQLNLGQYQQAYESLQRNRVFNDSIFNIERSKALLDMEKKYETEKKEQQIALQQAEIAEQKAELLFNRLLLIAAFVLVVLLLLIGLLIRNRLKKKQQLALQSQKIAAREAELNAAISSQEKERARYARDLHDGFGQMISILNLNLGSLKKDAKPAQRQKVFEESEKVINEMYDELKGICFDLMPHTLVKEGLQKAIAEFAARITSAGKLFVETNFFGFEERLDEVQEISIYRITQEWVNNVIKYSNATKITVQLTKDAEEITLLIEDDGQGFDKSLLLGSAGNGWKNLQSRSNLIQGVLEIETEENAKGTNLILNAPAIRKIPIASGDSMPAEYENSVS
ncbi:MAG: sensor histidine kinase [Bacteroidota bacterium]